MSHALFFTLISFSQAFAAGPGAHDWVEMPAFAPNKKMWLHDSAAKKSAPVSYVAVQEPSLSEKKVKIQFDLLKAESKPITELLPHHCYPVKKSGLKTRQTWCMNKLGKPFVFVEGGKERMSEGELLSVQLAALEGRK